MLACLDCNALHDFDLGPDDGTCVVCGGKLAEDETERDRYMTATESLQYGIIDEILTTQGLPKGKKK